MTIKEKETEALLRLREISEYLEDFRINKLRELNENLTKSKNFQSDCNKNLLINSKEENLAK